MKPGKIKTENLSKEKLKSILDDIILDCYYKADDSYSEFGRSTNKTLVKEKLVQYGEYEDY